MRKISNLEISGVIQEPGYESRIVKALELVESECNECNLKIESLTREKKRIEKELKEEQDKKDNLILMQDNDAELFRYYEEYLKNEESSKKCK